MTTSPVMHLLATGVPLALLCDLVSTQDPHSRSISLVERPVGDLLVVEAAAPAEDRRVLRLA